MANQVSVMENDFQRMLSISQHANKENVPRSCSFVASDGVFKKPALPARTRSNQTQLTPCVSRSSAPGQQNCSLESAKILYAPFVASPTNNGFSAASQQQPHPVPAATPSAQFTSAAPITCSNPISIANSSIKRAVPAFSPRLLSTPLGSSPLATSVHTARPPVPTHQPQFIASSSAVCFSSSSSLTHPTSPPRDMDVDVNTANHATSATDPLSPRAGSSQQFDVNEALTSPTYKLTNSLKITRSDGYLDTAFAARRERRKTQLMQPLTGDSSVQCADSAAPPSPSASSSAPPCDSIFAQPSLLLPCISSSSHPDLNCISADTVAALLRGQFSSQIRKYLIVDCRFEYEYRGGHIRGARNMSTEDLVDDAFRSPNTDSSDLVVIFYCEFSSYRGPRLWRHLRTWDRAVHTHQYPQLYYPNIFVLRDGYKGFWTQYAELCEPNAYVPMTDSRFSNECRVGLSTVQRTATKPKRSMSWAGGDFPRPLNERF